MYQQLYSESTIPWKLWLRYGGVFLNPTERLLGVIAILRMDAGLMLGGSGGRVM